MVFNHSYGEYQMMTKSVLVLPLLLATAAVGAAQAQSASAKTHCPSLPADSQLSWKHKSNDQGDFCRAIRADGSEAFSVYLAPHSPFEPRRSARAEHTTIDGQEVHWYRSELPLPDGAVARETVVNLPDGRVGHIWIQAGSEDQLQQTFRQTESLRFPAARLSSN